MLTPEGIRTKVKAILVDVLSLDIEPADIDEDELLFDGSLGLDSVAMIEILNEIEEHFGIEVADEEIGLQLFQTANSIAAVVEKHLPRQDG